MTYCGVKWIFLIFLVFFPRHFLVKPLTSVKNPFTQQFLGIISLIWPPWPILLRKKSNSKLNYWASTLFTYLELLLLFCFLLTKKSNELQKWHICLQPMFHHTRCSFYYTWNQFLPARDTYLPTTRHLFNLKDKSIRKSS